LTHTRVTAWPVAGDLPVRMKRAAKVLVKSILSSVISKMPGAAFRLAAFVEHNAGQHVRAERQPPMVAEANNNAAIRQSLDSLLAQADARLDHADVLTLLSRAGMLREVTLHRYLTALFMARRLDVMASILDCEELGFTVTRLFHRLKLKQYRGTPEQSSAAIAESYALLRGNPLHAEAALNLTIDNYTRLGDGAALAAYLQTIPCGEFSRIAPATFLGCFRLLNQAGLASDLEPWRQAFLAPLRTEQRLYHLDMMPPSSPERQLAASDWREILKLFRKAYSAADRADSMFVEQGVLAPLTGLPSGQLDLMNIRFDPGAKDRLMTTIETALRDRQPLCLVRLGDGEGYGYPAPDIPGVSVDRFAEDNSIRERMWWGNTISAAARDEVTAQFRQAVAAADVIGMPSIYRIIRDRGVPGSRFGENSGQRGLVVVLAQLGVSIPLTAAFTEERCHQLLFQRATIDKLAGLAERVVLVSCWRQDQIGLTARDVREIVIPPHTKVAGVTGQASGGSLATTYEAQVAEMAGYCAPGTLVLVGAGFIGKIFLGEARKRGAVALDVGAMLDYMAGYKTRSLADLA
jgi:hypothetical protein